jgi:hypothetical protein
MTVMTDRAFRAIAESSRHVVGHTFEAAIVVEKMSGREYDLGSHYGDPKVALIAPDEEWFIAGGEGLTYFSERTGLLEFLRHGLEDQDNELDVRYTDGAGGTHASKGVSPRAREAIFVERLEQLTSGQIAVYKDNESPSWVFDPIRLTVRRILVADPTSG